MDTSRVYYDSEGKDKTIHQMVRDEPEWAAVRIQVGEDAISKNANYLKLIERAIERLCMPIKQIRRDGFESLMIEMRKAIK
jgi:hypothetical protein